MSNGCLNIGLNCVQILVEFFLGGANKSAGSSHQIMFIIGVKKNSSHKKLASSVSQMLEYFKEIKTR